MWTNPRYRELTGRPAPGSASTAEAPEPAGETIFESTRNQGGERLRVSLETYQGHAFIRAQVWARNDAGDWWPTKGKCVTFRLRELPELIEALGRVAAGVTDREPAPMPRAEADDRPRYVPKHRERRVFTPSSLPPMPTGQAPEFSEL